MAGEDGLAPYALGKTLLVDVVQALSAIGVPVQDIPAKLEGMAFGPDVMIDGVAKHTLFISNDNDFLGTIIDAGHPAGIATPNMFMVFAIDAADLPNYQRQKIGGLHKPLK